jgi:hypothetical protein
MTLMQPLTLLTSNLGTTIEIVILFITGMACLIIAGKDIRIGSILFFIFSGLEWIWFYISGDITETYAMYIFFGSIVMLALSLTVTVKPVGGGFL